MQIHNSETLRAGEFPVSFNPGDGEPFAVIRIGHFRIMAESTDDADRLIRAGTEARRLLTEAPAEGGQ